MSEQMNLMGLSNAISSPALEDGATPFASLDGRMMNQRGPVPVPASLSAVQEKLKDFATRGTCGPLFEGSSPSAILQSSLESRLRARMAGRGSPEFALTWKEWDMPSGLPICALRASAPRTSGNGSTGWPTPMVFDGTNNGEPRALRFKGNAPSEQNHNRSPGTPGSYRGDLKDWAPVLCHWPTPQAHDVTGRSKKQKEKHGTKHGCSCLVQAAGWATPTTRDHKDGTEQSCQNVPTNKLLGREVHTFAGMEKLGGFRLNPHFSRWLMGFPPEWCACAVMAMQSYRRLPQNSSKPRGKH